MGQAVTSGNGVLMARKGMCYIHIYIYTPHYIPYIYIYIYVFIYIYICICVCDLSILYYKL